MNYNQNEEPIRRPDRMEMSDDQKMDPRKAKQRIGFSQAGGRGGMGADASGIYRQLDDRMHEAICFHSQLADYFCFLGLQGFKRMAEYQYMKECAALRKMHRRYIDMHHMILPMSECDTPDIIPGDWHRYTTHDIDDTVIPKFVRMALKQYYEWEHETKELYQELSRKLMDLGLVADHEYIKELLVDVEKECKKAMHLYESLNGTGYDVNAIHQMQDKYHEKYKKKYEEHFTLKWNDPGRWEPQNRRGRRTEIR